MWSCVNNILTFYSDLVVCRHFALKCRIWDGEVVLLVKYLLFKHEFSPKHLHKNIEPDDVLL